MVELINRTAVDHTYKTSYFSANKLLNIPMATEGARQNNSTATIINISMATFFSRLNMADKFCPETASCNSRLWRRMAMKIRTWFTMGVINSMTPTTRVRINATPEGKMNRSKTVHISQVAPAMKAACSVPVKKDVS